MGEKKNSPPPDAAHDVNEKEPFHTPPALELRPLRELEEEVPREVEDAAVEEHRCEESPPLSEDYLRSVLCAVQVQHVRAGSQRGVEL